ncbi:MAG TPA: methyltransferase domain-containing protein [Polyangiaceae bacterium]|jgi:dolichol-phosphate mannosyltransferase|nr:methyltransferase domain-containing protein [Polyangiaceae bacterium]
MLKKVLVFFPTYNEAGNVERLILTIRQFLPDCTVLVVDDASPDGTGELLDQLATTLQRLEVIHRPGKLGLGSAHKLAMLYARDAGFDALITMDADFSHHPRYLPKFLELLETADFVTGSRYMPGGKSDYGIGRTFISRTANLFAKAALGLDLEENTTMYRGFRAPLLARLRVEEIKSEGYSFAVDSLNQIAQVTDKLAEFPIHFENRATGASKISEVEIYRAMFTIQRIALGRLLPKRGEPIPHSSEEVACAGCGGTHHVQEFAPKREDRGIASDLSPYSCATHSSRSHGQILRCLRCGLVFMRPELSHDELVGEYESAVDPVYLEHLRARQTTFRRNLEQVRRHLRSVDRILEIGSYCGAFLKVARDAGFDITGVEPSRWAAQASRGITSAPVVTGTVEDLPASQRAFDVVVAWDVLEHFADPVEELRRINELLPDGGTLLFSTLMIDNWFPKLAGQYWPWLMDMHLFYFTESTIRQVLRTTGFELVDEGKYTHVVTLDYLLSKLGTLGVPGATELSKTVESSRLGRVEIPFRFGDIKLFVARKVSDVEPRSSVRSHVPGAPGLEETSLTAE